MRYAFPISVVMPCYNYEAYVSEAIESILRQSFTNFEFIIVNDGSTDNSDERIRVYHDKRIRYKKLPKNSGNYPARNIGMKMATGKYICVMDADDISHPDRLRIQFNYLESHPSVAMVGSQALCIDENSKLTGNQIVKPICAARQLHVYLLANNFTLHPSILFRCKLLHRYGLYYNEAYKVASDYDFAARVSKLFPIINLEDILLKYRLHTSQISATSNHLQDEYAGIIKYKLLKTLVPKPSPKEKEIYLKLMELHRILNEKDLLIGLHLCNKILDRNMVLKLYDHHMLYAFLQHVLYKVKPTNTVAV